MKKLVSAAAIAVVVAGLAAVSPAHADQDDAGRSPQATPEASAVYIVQFKPGTNNDSEAQKTRDGGGQVEHQYRSAINGMSARLTPSQLAALQADPNVLRIEADGPVHTMAVTSPQTPTPSWGLDRIDQRAKTLDSSYAFTGNGAGVTAYVIDTGIDPTGQDFASRVLPGNDQILDGNGTKDCNGHGTHVSGTIGGDLYGVAKGVSLVPVRVLNCAGSGTWAGVVAGIDWAVANHVSGPAVANMSLGGGASATVDAAVQRLVADGVTVGVAAGNSNLDACTTSPARTPEAITVGATDSTDARASYSNFGTCLDIFAPGSNITSSWMNGGTNTISGTSMATPHVVGAAALFLGANPAASPAAVAAGLIAASTTNAVTTPGTGSPNRLLFTGSTALATTVSSFSPASGSVGTTVTISGSTLSGATAVTFNGVSATITSNSDTSITATVPAGATTGKIAVTTPAGTGTSTASFTVLAAPTITSFTPTSAYPGSTVTISGTGFTGATSVKFNGTAATFTVSSATAISATVPTGATSGTISVTNAVGTATSSTSFSVLVPTAPSAPTNVKATASTTAGRASVTWTRSASTNGSAITSQRITAYRVSTGTTSTYTVSSTTTAVTITGLVSGQSYQFSVASLNGVGWSAESAKSTAITVK